MRKKETFDRETINTGLTLARQKSTNINLKCNSNGNSSREDFFLRLETKIRNESILHRLKLIYKFIKLSRFMLRENDDKIFSRISFISIVENKNNLV